MERAFGIREWTAENVYEEMIPVHDHTANKRTFRPQPMLLLHEQVAKAFARDPTVFRPRPEGQTTMSELPRYRESELLQTKGWNNVALLGLYIDQAPIFQTGRFCGDILEQCL